MSLVDTRGEAVEIARVIIGPMGPREMRAFAIGLFRRAGKTTCEIALAMRCSEPTIRRDARVKAPDSLSFRSDRESRRLRGW